MLAQKKMLSVADLESQMAVELPDRELPLVTIVVFNVLREVDVTITVRDVNVAAIVCANLLATGIFQNCRIQQ